MLSIGSCVLVFYCYGKNIGEGLSKSYDASKFVNFKAQKSFMDQHKIHVIQERGLVHRIEYEVSNTIKDNKWEILCEHQAPCVVSIVQEFYAMVRNGTISRYLYEASVFHLIRLSLTIFMG